jgi:alanine racemase
MSAKAFGPPVILDTGTHPANFSQQLIRMSISTPLDLPDSSVSAADPVDNSTSRNRVETLPARLPTPLAPRSAWVEIDLRRLRRNFALIQKDKPPGLQILSVVKDEGYGHGALAVARAALDTGAGFLALSTVEEAVRLRDQGIRAQLLLLGDRQESELPWCIDHDLTCSVGEPQNVRKLAQLAERAGKRVPVHLKINTGMNRYGVRWTEAAALAQAIHASPHLVLEGVLSHFSQSDETDKTFALLQLGRFEEALRAIAAQGNPVPLRHLCNSGGFLDLPRAHFDMVRLGILPLGVFPSSVCRRIPGIEPVMSVKARIAAIQKLDVGDCVGYGMRFTAASPRRIAVLPLGYGDGFPRVRNAGCALIHGMRAPLVGGVAMDALTVDITDIPAAQLWDEAVLMGRQGNDEISVHEVAKLKGSVSYDVLTSWRARLPRIYVE